MSTPIRQEIVFDVSANAAKFTSESKKAEIASDKVREAISKGTRELTKQEVQAAAVAEATKKINKAAIDAAVSAERMRRQFEQARVPAAGLVQSIGSMASGMLSVVGKVGMVIAGFRELQRAAEKFDQTIADLEIPEWLFSTGGSKELRQANRNRAIISTSLNTAMAINSLGLQQEREENFVRTALREGNRAGAGAQGFRDPAGFAGAIGSSFGSVGMLTPIERARRSGGRSRVDMADVAGQSMGFNTTAFSFTDASSAFGGAASGGGSDVAGIASMFGGGAQGGASGAHWQDQSSRMDEFTAKLQDQSSLVGGAFGTIASGMSAAIDAAITGSESIGAAIKKALGAQLKAIAIESGVRALFETAKGFAALAFGSPTAAAHFKSAAIFGATALAAGVGSAALGGGASASSQPTSGGSAQTQNLASSGRSQQSGGGQTIVININGMVGDGHAVAEQIHKAMNVAQRTGMAASIRAQEAQVSRYE